jgi:hypothetical protein
MARQSRRTRTRTRTKPGFSLEQLPWKPLRNPWSPLEVVSEEAIERMHDGSKHDHGGCQLHRHQRAHPCPDPVGAGRIETGYAIIGDILSFSHN